MRSSSSSSLSIRLQNQVERRWCSWDNYNLRVGGGWFKKQMAEMRSMIICNYNNSCKKGGRRYNIHIYEEDDEDEKKFVEVIRSIKPAMLMHRGRTFVIVLSSHILDAPNYYFHRLLQVFQ
ncbi:hypothetical protein M5689_012928 [Euphorbia peplus]|nr:hypothetical protein M5689_012928 [Euphorbia peplus]